MDLPNNGNFENEETKYLVILDEEAGLGGTLTTSLATGKLLPTPGEDH